MRCACRIEGLPHADATAPGGGGGGGAVRARLRVWAARGVPVGSGKREALERARERLLSELEAPNSRLPATRTNRSRSGAPSWSKSSARIYRDIDEA